jgi:hypothetical protein
MYHAPPARTGAIPRTSLEDMATQAGREYARAGWSNADVAAAAWLRGGSLAAVANEVNPIAAEQAFVRGFRAARAGR